MIQLAPRDRLAIRMSPYDVDIVAHIQEHYPGAEIVAFGANDDVYDRVPVHEISTGSETRIYLREGTIAEQRAWFQITRFEISLDDVDGKIELASGVVRPAIPVGPNITPYISFHWTGA